MAFAIIAGLDYDSPVREFNVRPEPGTSPSVVLFKASLSDVRCEILDVQPDNQGMKQPNGEVYQWFRLRFEDGREGWLRSHVLKIEGDLTRFGYGTVAAATYAYRLIRVIAEVAPAPPEIPSPTQPVEPPEATVPETPASPAPTPAPVPAPTPDIPAPPAPEPTTDLCAGTVTAARGANLRESPVNGDSLAIIPFEAVVTVQEIRSVAGEQHRWVQVDYDGTEGWTREDLLSYSGSCARFNLRVTSTTPAQPITYTEYTATALYPVPMARYRFIRGFTGHQPNHPGVDYGGDDGEPILTGPVGGLVVASKECIRCNIPGKPSTLLQGLGLGDERVFSDENWNFGFGHYMIVRYLHKQLPPSTRRALENANLPGAHVYAMYAHLSRRNADVGAVLAPNQVFAFCGNTGNSSGPHLHLELRVSSSPQFSSWAALAGGLIDPLVMFER
ncbi:MAG: hypothetical protein CL610_12965 [Anaerolineaceae bacterium]|nr:hypothetical protein [Anaerolineaceae bacterium]